MALPATSRNTRMVIFFHSFVLTGAPRRGRKTRGGVSGSRRRRRSARWAVSSLLRRRANREMARLQDLGGGGEPRGGAASGSLRRRRTTGRGRRRRIRAATNRRRLVQFSSSRVDCISTGIFHTDNELIRMYAFRRGDGAFFRLICVLVGN
jgi:hypothetical protein